MQSTGKNELIESSNNGNVYGQFVAHLEGKVSECDLPVNISMNSFSEIDENFDNSI